MKGLLVKDICIILQQKKFFGLLLLLSVFLNSTDSPTFSVSYLTFVCSFFVYASCQTGELCRSQIYLSCFHGSVLLAIGLPDCSGLLFCKKSACPYADGNGGGMYCFVAHSVIYGDYASGSV